MSERERGAGVGGSSRYRFTASACVRAHHPKLKGKKTLQYSDLESALGQIVLFVSIKQVLFIWKLQKLESFYCLTMFSDD